MQKEIYKPEDIKSNEILIESELSEFQQKIYLEVEKQLQQSDHPINLMIQTFHRYFVQEYGKYTDLDKSTPQQLKQMIRKRSKILQKAYLNQNQNSSHGSNSVNIQLLDEDSNLGSFNPFDQIDFSSKVINEAVEFLDIVFTTMYQFYESVLTPNDIHILQEDFFKLIIFLTLRDRVHQIIIVLIRVQGEKHDRDVRLKSRLLPHLTPQEVGVDNYLLLNDKTPINDIIRNSFEATGENQGEEAKSEDNSDFINFPVEEIKSEEYVENKDWDPRRSDFKSIITEKDVQSRLREKPYYESVKMLRQLPFKECPFEKLFLLNEVRRSIEKNIKRFWAGIQVPRDKLELGADQFISIFVFIILKAEIDDFQSQVQFIQSFNSSYILDKSKYGHTLQTVITALNRILRLDQQKIQEPNYLRSAILEVENDKRNMNDNSSSNDDSCSTFNPFMIFDKKPLLANMGNRSYKITTFKERQTIRNSYHSQRDKSLREQSFKMN